MSDGQDNIIIVKKGKKGGHGHHGGAWKVAYADFVTAMMALFIVLWVLGQNDDVKKSVSSYFKDPTGYSPYGKNVITGAPSSPLPITTTKSQKREEEKLKFEEMKSKIQEELGQNQAFASVSQYIEFEMINEGLRIELLESADNIFFGIGSSQLNANASKLIQEIGQQVATLNNNIVIEGHTDARPFVAGSENYTNYELSTDRANAARRALIKGGVSSKQIDEIRGCADKRLRNPEDPYSLVNRRISIVIKYLE